MGEEVTQGTDTDGTAWVRRVTQGTDADGAVWVLSNIEVFSAPPMTGLGRIVGPWSPTSYTHVVKPCFYIMHINFIPVFVWNAYGCAQNKIPHVWKSKSKYFM